MISDVTWPEPQPLSCMTAPGGKGGSRWVNKCLFVSSEVVPIIASNRAAVLGSICFGVKEDLIVEAMMMKNWMETIYVPREKNLRALGCVSSWNISELMREKTTLEVLVRFIALDRHRCPIASRKHFNDRSGSITS